MTEGAVFTAEEFDERLAAVRWKMRMRKLDAAIITRPENIYYLCGLDHQGFFAFHSLLVPPEGPLTLVTREMERATVAAQVPQVVFRGHTDGSDVAGVLADVLREHKLNRARLGLETFSQAFPPAICDALRHNLPNAQWVDATWLVDEMRLIKSPAEIAYLRQAAAVSDAMLEAALAVAKPGNNEKDVASEVHRAMIQAGGGHPGFAPFIRPSPRLAQEHTTWQDREIREDEALFVEMAGCVHRYHAPLGRLIYHRAPDAATQRIRAVCQEAFDAVVDALAPGATAGEVYAAWQGVVDAAGLAHYRRHHCGYLVGLAFPPSWTGGSAVVGLRRDSPLELKAGMAFHILSWLMNTGEGDYFLSNTVLLGEGGAEVLTGGPVP